MSTMIMDLCSYTRLGLTGYLTSRGIKKQEIVEVNSAADLPETLYVVLPGGGVSE